MKFYKYQELDKTCIKIYNKMRRLYKKWKALQIQKYKVQFRKVKATLKYRIINHQRNYEKSICDLKNSKLVFKYINNKFIDKIIIFKIKNSDTTKTSDNNEISEILMIILLKSLITLI